MQVGWARWVAAAVVTGAVLVGAGAPGAAQEPGAGQVAAAITEQGWYAHPGAVGDREQLMAVAERLAVQGDPMGFALLDAEPPGGSTAYAEDVLDELVDRGERHYRTVVVLSDADVGVVSDVWSDDAIDAALDETIDELRADPTDGLEALADALAAEPAGFTDDGGDTGTGGGGLSAGWIALGVLVVGGLVAYRRLVPATGGGYDDGDGWSSSSSYRRRRRMSSFRSSSRRSGSSRRSSSRSASRSRGRGGRRL